MFKMHRLLLMQKGRMMTVKDLIKQLLEVESLDSEVEIEFDKTKIPDDTYKYCQLSVKDIFGFGGCTIIAEVIE